MLAAVEAIESYSVSNFKQFESDEKTQDAIMFNLIIMGEAAKQVSDGFQEKHSYTPWASIIGTRM